MTELAQPRLHQLSSRPTRQHCAQQTPPIGRRRLAAIAAVFSAVATIFPAVLPAVYTVRDHRRGAHDGRGAGNGRADDAPSGHPCWS
jgi:hypothetical protein